jgi:integrase
MLVALLAIPSIPSILQSVRRCAASDASMAVRRGEQQPSPRPRSASAWACGRDLAGARDRVLFLLGFAGALRRSELVGLDGEHLIWTGDGLKMLIVRSKTDAEGEGAESAIPRGRADSTCPVTALEAWLELSEISAGPLFGALRGSAFWPANAVHPCNTWNPLLLGA